MNTKALRQKILDLAIRGKLVPQDPNDEPASVLLERIRAEKQQMVKDGKLKAKDIKNDTVIFLGDDNLHYEKFPDGTVKCIEDEIPFELPEGWEWTRIFSVSFNLPYGTAKKSDSNGKVAVLRMGNLQNGEIDYSDLVYSSDDEDINQYELLENDLLFNRTNSAEWVGKTAIYRGGVKAIYAGYLIRLRTGLNAEYLNAVMNSQYERDYCNMVKTDGVNQSNINAQKLGAFLIPVPSISEQCRIVCKFNNLLSFIETIESDKTDLQTTIQLTKSKILDLAIRGKLVPQNPDDEPASVLLDRVRAEKEELIKQGKIKRDKKESVIYKGDDNSYYGDIPDNWEVASISQLNYYQSSSVNPLLFPDEYFELFSVPNYDIGIPEIVKGNEIGSTKQSVESKDVLLCKINPRINRVWTVTCVTEYKTIASSEWIVFRNPFLYSPYVTIYLSSPLFRELLLTNVSGVGGSLMRAQPDSVKKYPVVIPPYEEQKRIADKVSQLFSLLDSIAENVN